MNKTRTHTRLNNKIVELAKSKTQGQLMEIIHNKISKIDLMSVPGENISSMIVTDLGILFKTAPSGNSITLTALSVDDKLDILDKMK